MVVWVCSLAFCFVCLWVVGAVQLLGLCGCCCLWFGCCFGVCFVVVVAGCMLGFGGGYVEVVVREPFLVWVWWFCTVP